jgi:hypothetical protein
MKAQLLIAASLLAAASLACTINIDLPSFGVPRIDTGPTQTVSISEAAPAGAEVVDLTVNMAAGRLDIAGGATEQVEGEISYNVAEWEPAVSRDGAAITISQRRIGNGGLPRGQVVNDWALRLGETPMNLTINSGAYEGTLALGGLPVRRLAISDGASNARVSFDSLNLEDMELLSYDTGASSVTLTGLANANFAEMRFNGGAGDFTLDFSGDLQRDATVNTRAGVASLRIVVPAATAARVVVTSSLTNINTQGTWNQTGSTYETGGSGPLLTINVDMGVGSLTLVSQ